MKKKVLKQFPGAYCRRLNDGTGYIIWPGKIQPRGHEKCAIGIGVTAAKAWASVHIGKLYLKEHTSVLGSKGDE